MYSIYYIYFLTIDIYYVILHKYKSDNNCDSVAAQTDAIVAGTWNWTWIGRGCL